MIQAGEFLPVSCMILPVNAYSFPFMGKNATIWLEMTYCSVRKQKGFTLGELLIVVAIIGVLVAVSIPIFTGQLEKAKLATCQANRRSLLAEVRIKALDDDISQEEAFKEVYTDASKYPCPKGGTFSFENGVIKCSVHDETGGTVIDAGGSKILVTAKIDQGHADKEKVDFRNGTICKVGNDYYIMTNDFTGSTVSGDYVQWFVKIVVNGTWGPAKEINMKKIWSPSSTASEYLTVGSLYSDGKTIYVVKSSAYINTITINNLVKMEDILDSIIDYRGRTPQKSIKGIPTLSAKSVKNGFIDYSNCYYISEHEYKWNGYDCYNPIIDWHGKDPIPPTGLPSMILVKDNSITMASGYDGFKILDDYNRHQNVE